MPGITQPTGVWVSMLYLVYLGIVSSKRLLTLLLDEENLKGDWATTMMRLSPLGAFLAIFGSLIGIFVLVFLGYYGDGEGLFIIPTAINKPFEGMPEFVFSLTIVSSVYVYRFRREMSEDAAFIVGFVVWNVGILLSMPVKLLMNNIPLANGWASGIPFLYCYMFSHSYLLRKYREWRSEKEADGSYTKNKVLDEFVALLEYEMRWTRPLVYTTFALWILTIEAYLEMNNVGYAFASLYYVLIGFVLTGCINEYRINDF